LRQINNLANSAQPIRMRAPQISALAVLNGAACLHPAS